MYKCISILGSTGSIGKQTLEVCEQLGIDVYGLAAGSNIDELYTQIVKFNVKVASVATKDLADELEKRLDGEGITTKIYYGDEGVKAVVNHSSVECVMSAIVGIAGLRPTMYAIEADKDIALANKETLVTAGKFVTDEINKRGLKLLPVDSEHSAIFQSLMGNSKKGVDKIILTSSGGPFLNTPIEEMEKAIPSDALKHPNWDMGAKITIDSATMMNKGLEVIEARWLFDVKADNIDVVVHPESIVHSMVQYVDSSVIAQLGLPDMRLPIQFAITYPDRFDGNLESLDLTKVGTLNFIKPDLTRFRCLSLAYEALKCGDTMCNILNAANEIAVQLFLDGKIGFMDIPVLIEKAMNEHKMLSQKSIEDVFKIDKQVREWLKNNYK